MKTDYYSSNISYVWILLDVSEKNWTVFDSVVWLKRPRSVRGLLLFFQKLLVNIFVTVFEAVFGNQKLVNVCWSHAGSTFVMGCVGVGSWSVFCWAAKLWWRRKPRSKTHRVLDNGCIKTHVCSAWHSRWTVRPSWNRFELSAEWIKLCIE